VPDADGDELDRGLLLDPVDHAAQVLLEVARRVHRQRRIVDRRAVRNDHQDAAILGSGEQARVRPEQRLAVDVFLQQTLAHHQAEVAPGATPGGVRRLVDDVPQIIEPARVRRLAGPDPVLARQSAFPRLGREPQDLDLDPAPLQRPRQDVGADRRHHDRPPAHRAGVVEQQGHDRVAERALALGLERQGGGRVGDDPGQPRRVQHSLFQIEDPGAVLLRQQAPLQLVGQARHDAGQDGQLAVQQGAQPVQLDRVAQVGGVHHLVEGGGEDAVEIDRATVVGRLLTVRLLAFLKFRAIVGAFAVGIGRRAFGATFALLLGRLIVGVALHRLGAFAAVLLFLLVLIVVGRRVLRIGLLVAGIFGRIFAAPVAGIEVQRAQHLAHLQCKAFLIARRSGQGVQLGARLGLDVGAHQIQHGPGAVGGGAPGQPLAHQQGHGLGHGHAVGVADPQGAGLFQSRDQGGAQIVAHSGKMFRTEGLNARLFDRIEHLSRLGVRWPHPAVHRRIVIG